MAGADLRGANVASANFTHAHLPGAKLTGIFGKAKGLRRAGLAARTWNPDRQPCDSNPQYWDKLASATPAATASPPTHLAGVQPSDARVNPPR